MTVSHPLENGVEAPHHLVYIKVCLSDRNTLCKGNCQRIKTYGTETTFIIICINAVFETNR